MVKKVVQGIKAFEHLVPVAKKKLDDKTAVWADVAVLDIFEHFVPQDLKQQAADIVKGVRELTQKAPDARAKRQAAEGSGAACSSRPAKKKTRTDDGQAEARRMFAKHRE